LTKHAGYVEKFAAHSQRPAAAAAGPESPAAREKKSGTFAPCPFRGKARKPRY
jgi:hypothetical protein